MTTVEPAAAQVWAALGGEAARLGAVEWSRTDEALPAIVPVTAAASAAVGVATLTIADLAGDPGPVRVDGLHAVWSFRGERLLRVDGGPPPTPWDPLAGDYRARDGWVRLHTNYAHHRAAALRALDVPGTATRADVAAAVGTRDAVVIEDAVTAHGGCAAALRSREQWRAHPQGRAVAELPVIELARRGDAPPVEHRPGVRPLDGVRVLDLTRVIAGPTTSRVLAAWGADVLRIDPPGFAEVEVLVRETTTGKRTAFLDLRSPAGRDRMDALVRDADVLLAGYRPGAVEALGWTPSRLAALNPSLVTASLSAYGASGPWAGRRGFDSLVQVTSGLAHEARAAAGQGDDAPPVSLPAQALDYLTGWFLVAGIAVALRRRATVGGAWHAGAVLARTARWLDDLGRVDGGLRIADAAPGLPTDEFTGPLGRTAHVACPGAIGRSVPRWAGPPVPLGAHAATW